MNKKHIEVVAAILHFNGRYLAVQRGASALDYVSHKWEFPGGKVEAGESLSAALVRELHEELALTVEQLDFLLTVEHCYPDFDITMHCFVVPLESAQLTLTEHIAKRWLWPNELMSVDWAQADLPAVERLMTLHAGEVS